MRSGADVIYQATFFHGRWRGQADFLERVESPSELGDYSYEVMDTKLARHAKVGAILQTSNYSEHVTRLQGAKPERMHLILGDRTRLSYLVSDFGAYYRAVKRRLEGIVDKGHQPGTTYPDPVAHCAMCDWVEQCVERRIADDHLSLVAGMGRHQIERLREHGVTTLAGLGALDATTVSGIGNQTLTKLHNQARLQLSQRETGEVSFELLPHEGDKRGLAALPEPSPGDLFFDMEGDPYVGVHGIEYLFGVTELVGDEQKYTAFWGHDDAGEKRAFEQFVDLVMQRLAADPALHIYHYAPYEPTAMKKLAGRHATRETELDALLRGGVFVDLYRVVRQGIRTSQDSYSIKKLEPFYMGQRETEVVGGAQSIEAYEEWLETTDQSILDDIEAYNRDDCESTLHLRNWLEDRRAEAVQQFGDIPRPSEDDKAPSAQVSELDAAIGELNNALTGDVPETGATSVQHGRWLLAKLLEWHRRENKSEWWRHFELQDMTDDELFEDREALAGLEYEGVVGTVKRSQVHRYRFDPEQDHKMGVGNQADPRSGKGVTVVALDDEQGTIDIKRGVGSDAEHPRSLVPPKPRGDSEQQRALIALGRWVADNGIDSPGKFRAVRDLLLCDPPRLQSGNSLASVVAGADGPSEATCTVVGDLEQSCLAVQGPPGSGKTYTGADLVLSLVASGKRVGITATSHKVIGNLLDEVAKHATKQGALVRMMQKADQSNRCSSPQVESVDSNDAVEKALTDNAVDVVGATAWLFSREAFREAFDVLVVDEAGQMSLADVLAVGTATRSLVLLGDPQQLAQPSKGVHPEGAGTSALAHLLGGHATMPRDLGLLLDRTWRMHPEVCRFISDRFYESRLQSVPECAKQSIEGHDEWGGVGMRYVAVDHKDNRTSSPEEAATIAEGVSALVGRPWTNLEGETTPITLDDVLIVTPYNAQVSLLKRSLPEGARVGTVDKFQGQEAAVVLYSLAASSPEDISRGMEFLYSLNRTNVALSRARCLAVLVCSPALMTIACRTPAQARLANSLCSFVEVAAEQA